MLFARTSSRLSGHAFRGADCDIYNAGAWAMAPQLEAVLPTRKHNSEKHPAHGK